MAGLKVPFWEVEGQLRMNRGEREVHDHGEEREASRTCGKLRLRALLRDLVREEGRMEAAELLGVNYKTLVKDHRVGRPVQAHERRVGAADADRGSARSGASERTHR